MRHRPQRGGASLLLAVCLAAGVRSSAAPVLTTVAGVRVDRPVSVAGPAAGMVDQVGLDQLVAQQVADRVVADASTTPNRQAAPAGENPTPAPRTAEPLGQPSPTSRPATERVLTQNVGGVERQWTVVIPPDTTNDVALPMVIVLHGVGGKGANMRGLGFEKFASSRGVLMVYPDATGGSWNDGRPGMEPLTGAPVDDVAFLRALIARTAAEVGGDPTRVSMVGYSNGALMASRAACDMTNALRSVVLVSGAGPRDMAQRCEPSRSLPVMIVFGTADQTVPYEGGSVASHSGKSRGQVASVREFLEVWRKTNGCEPVLAQELVSTSPSITAMRGAACRADVVHYRLTGGGHEWVNSAGFATTGEAWKFTARHLG